MIESAIPVLHARDVSHEPTTPVLHAPDVIYEPATTAFNAPDVRHEPVTTTLHAPDVLRDKFYINVLFYLVPASLPPSPPGNIRIESTGREFLVRWHPPLLTDGEILSYLINYNILPSLRVYTIVVKGNQSFALIPFGDHIGQLFLISLQAENDYGLSKQSIPRYIRTGCGNQQYIDTNGTQEMESPLYPHEFHQGVLCVWNLFTNKTHTISIHIKDMDLGTDNQGCAKHVLLIESDKIKKKICTKISDIRLEDSDVRIVFQSKIGTVGKGFSLLVKAVVKNPKPPVNITLSHLGNVILVTWSPPPENHLPITSYKLCYRPLPRYSKICIIVLANRGNRFIINTQGHKGQLFLVTMTARIGDVESEFSMNKYFRASCSKTVTVNPGQIINIMSPGYPTSYPPGVICQWTVKTVDQSPLRIRRIWIDIQNTTACNSDFLKFTATKIERICGTTRSSSTMIFSKSIAEVTFVSDSTIEGRGFLLQAIGSQNTVELTTTVFPYQHKGTSMSTIPTSLSTSSESQVESSVKELSFPTKKSSSSTVMSTITATSQRIITSAQRVITSSQSMITSSQRLIMSSQRLITSSQSMITSSQRTVVQFSEPQFCE
ncbi:cubilin-like [Mytilus galloprovincialis]|uniref:cubilin-like n=1 Tax=Mytilus galloprovincialis TaxID=29158 RepID=UPI003F7BEFA2